MSRKIQQARFHQKGSALVYILIAIALLAALTITFMEPSSQQTSSQNTFKTVAEIQGQISMIRSAIEECVLSYPRGDDDITDVGARKEYPINPDSTYYTGATPGRSGDHLVEHIRCPGDNPGGVDQADHQLIFSGVSGKQLPPPPDLFEPWQLYNGVDGVFFWTSTDKSDAYLAAALAKLDGEYAECETDVIDATAGAEDLDSGSSLECDSGSLCFRVRVLEKAPSVYNGDTDNDESAC